LYIYENNIFIVPFCLAYFIKFFGRFKSNFSIFQRKIPRSTHNLNSFINKKAILTSFLSIYKAHPGDHLGKLKDKHIDF